MLATLSTCAQLERDNITFRLQSGRKQYIAKGGKLGRNSTKSAEQKKEEYREAIWAKLMADDQIWDYVEDFMEGSITREAFWVLAKFKYPTHQIVFCTQKALEAITYERSYRI